VPKLAGIPHLQAVRALEKAGFSVVRQGKHLVEHEQPEEASSAKIKIKKE